MSNFLAPATVTAAVQLLLSHPAAADVPGATVTTDRPDSKKNQTTPQINVYLYQITPNVFARDADLPTRRADGSLAGRPSAALDLHYLLTFYGDDKELEPQRLMGVAVRTLHVQPVITRELIAAVVDSANAATPLHPSLATTDLADAADLVRICPLSLDLEELSRVWSVFFQTPYALSTAYTASAVRVEDDSEPTWGPPVIAPVLSVFPLAKPEVTSVQVTDQPFAPITAASSITIAGTQLSGDQTFVRIAGVELDPVTVSASTVVVDLAAAATLRAGTLALQVGRRRLVSRPPELRGETLSPVVTIQLHPRVVAVTLTGGEVRASTDVTVGAGQQAVLHLTSTTTGAVMVLNAEARTVDATALEFPAAAVPAGTYGVVVLVDGAPSALVRDAGGQITSPTVTVP